MRRICIGVAALAVLLPVAPAGAQAGAYRFPDPTILVGSGASIGVHVRDVSADELKNAKLDSGGVFIEQVMSGTPAERAGLKAGDIVTEFDGERVRSARGFSRLVSETPPQRTVKATVVRDGARRTIDVTPEPSTALRNFDNLKALPRELPLLRQVPAPPAVPAVPRFDVAPLPRRIGATVSALSDQLAAYFGVRAGLLVSAVDEDSPASRAGLKAGDVITSANGQAVTRPAELNGAVRDVSPGTAFELKVMRERKELTLQVTF